MRVCCFQTRFFFYRLERWIVNPLIHPKKIHLQSGATIFKMWKIRILITRQKNLVDVSKENENSISNSSGCLQKESSGCLQISYSKSSGSAKENENHCQTYFRYIRDLAARSSVELYTSLRQIGAAPKLQNTWAGLRSEQHQTQRLPLFQLVLLGSLFGADLFVTLFPFIVDKVLPGRRLRVFFRIPVLPACSVSETVLGEVRLGAPW